MLQLVSPNLEANLATNLLGQLLPPVDKIGPEGVGLVYVCWARGCDQDEAESRCFQNVGYMVGAYTPS